MWDYNMRNGEKAIYKVTSAWDVNTATWKIPWTHEGADFDSLNPIASSSHKDTTVMVWERFDVTAVVKQHISNPSANYGFLIKFNDNDRRGIMVYSSESKETDKRPKLVINPGITGVYAEADAVHPQISLSRVGNALRLQLPAAGDWESATVYGLDGRTIASVRMKTSMDACRINGSFARGACFVRLHGKKSELVKKFILAE